MIRLWVAIVSLVLLLGSGMAGSALAGPVTYDLNAASNRKIGSGTLGNITLVQNGPNQVVVGVRLAPGTGFISNRHSHNALAFNLDLKTPYAIRISDPLHHIFSSGSRHISSTPYGRFTDYIDCSGFRSGERNAYPEPLTFSVTDADGITVSDFIANSNGFYFSADVNNPAGGSRSIAASGTTAILASSSASAVPEPASLPLLAGSMIALGLIVRKRKR